MTAFELVQTLEAFAPRALQEDYDNSGFQVGNPGVSVKGVLISLDVNEEVLEEARELGINLVIAHHPLIFSGIKRLTGGNWVERTIQKAIQYDITVYAIHTNLDVVAGGVSGEMATRLGLEKLKVLDPAANRLVKLVSFVPMDFLEKVRDAVFEAGAGHIGAYDQCGFSVDGTGTFRGLEGANPFVGKAGTRHFEKETRFETILPDYLQDQVVAALLQAHPYEEVAYDLIPLRNQAKTLGMGILGEFQKPVGENDFLALLSQVFGCPVFRHSPLTGKTIRRVAVCGGSGSFLLKKALQAKADAFVTGDFRYHQFFDADQKILIADVGHFESEQYSMQLLQRLLSEKCATFAPVISGVKTNPVNYFTR